MRMKSKVKDIDKSVLYNIIIEYNVNCITKGKRWLVIQTVISSQIDCRT